jgi:hypothetical protein
MTEQSDYPRRWRWRNTLGAPHPLACRIGQPVRVICRGSNGNELMEFPDGFRTVAPWRAALRSKS